jgi:hypothetical protein
MLKRTLGAHAFVIGANAVQCSLKGGSVDVGLFLAMAQERSCYVKVCGRGPEGGGVMRSIDCRCTQRSLQVVAPLFLQCFGAFPCDGLVPVQIHEALLAVCSLDDDTALTDSGSDSDSAPRKRRHRLESVTFFNGRKGAQKRISCVVDGDNVNFFVNCMPAVCFSALFQSACRELGHRSLLKRSAVLLQVCVGAPFPLPSPVSPRAYALAPCAWAVPSSPLLVRQWATGLVCMLHPVRCFFCCPV